MKRLIKTILGIASVILFLAATSGVRVYTHYCSAAATLNSSIIESFADCDEHLPVDGVAIIETAEESCCTGSSSCKETEAGNDDCCTDDSHFIKIADDFYSHSTPDWKTSIQRLLENAQSTRTKDELEHSDEVFWDICNDSSHSPPRSGKKLVLFLHQQKTEPNHIA